MSRDDVANLVIRTFALWLGAAGLGTLASIPWMIEGPGGRGMIVMVALAYLGAAAIVWLAAPPLARAMFARPDRDVPFALSARGVPALASFVTGLFVLAGAVPQAIAWTALQVMRLSMSASVLDSLDSRATDALDRRTIESGAEVLAQIAVGVVLLALSRRPNFWPIPDVADDAPIDEPDPPA